MRKMRINIIWVNMSNTNSNWVNMSKCSTNFPLSTLDNLFKTFL